MSEQRKITVEPRKTNRTTSWTQHHHQVRKTMQIFCCVLPLRPILLCNPLCNICLLKNLLSVGSRLEQHDYMFTLWRSVTATFGRFYMNHSCIPIGTGHLFVTGKDPVIHDGKTRRNEDGFLPFIRRRKFRSSTSGYVDLSHCKQMDLLFFSLVYHFLWCWSPVYSYSNVAIRKRIGRPPK